MLDINNTMLNQLEKAYYNHEKAVNQYVLTLEDISSAALKSVAGIVGGMS
jgi:hypothetical protein